jgi:hypothetical protein
MHLFCLLLSAALRRCIGAYAQRGWREVLIWRVPTSDGWPGRV